MVTRSDRSLGMNESATIRPMTDWVRLGGGVVLVDLWVVPGASRTRVMGRRGDRVKLCVAAPPERGKANEAMLTYLRERLAPASVLLVSGISGRAKTVSVDGLEAAEVEARLAG
jgi:uncharacterized protein